MAETIQGPENPIVETPFSIGDVKNFLGQTKGPFAKENFTIIDEKQRITPLHLFWDIRTTTQKNGVTYMEVPYVDENNMPTHPTHTLVFWKNASGELEARYKTYQYPTKDNKLTGLILLESIYDITGNHIQSIVHEKGQKKKVKIQPANTATRMSDGGCSTFGFTYVTVICEVQAAEFAITCRVNYEPYYYTSCGGGDPTEDQQAPTDGGGSGGGDSAEPEPEVENENIVDVEKLLKCFDNIPDNGASYIVRLLIDIPVNATSNIPINLAQGGSPGHTFLEITKKNGSQTITQTFGFYPETGLKSVLTPYPVESAIKNDGDIYTSPHEYNAVYTLVPLSPNSYSILQAAILSESKKPYHLQFNNCSHFATNVINSVLEPYEKIIPLGWPFIHPVTHMPMYFTNSPSGLYNKFAQMKQNGTWTSSRITLGVNERAKASKGECD